MTTTPSAQRAPWAKQEEEQTDKLLTWALSTVGYGIDLGVSAGRRGGTL